MKWRRGLAVLLASVWLSGCAFQNALQNGHDQAGSQHYRQALASYQEALRLDPDSAEARRHVSQITPYAVRDAAVDARAAAARGDYERAMRHAGYVRTLDARSAKLLEQEIGQHLDAELQQLLDRGDMARAYPLAARARRLLPKLASLPASFARLRQHYYGESERLLGEQRFAEALVPLQQVSRHEPQLQPEVQARSQRVRHRWADVVALRGQAAEEEHKLGAATAHYARAHEIAGRAEHAAALQRIRTGLREDGGFLLGLKDAADHRSAQLAKRIAHAAQAIEGLRLPTDDEPHVTLAVAVEASAAQCDERTEISQGSHDYVAGQRRDPNPAYAQIEQAIADAERTVVRLSRRSQRSQRRAQQLRNEARSCSSGGSSAAARVDQARAARDAAQAAVEQQREKVRRLEQRSPQGHPPADGDGDARKRRRGRRQKRLAKARAELRRRVAVERTASSTLAQRERELRRHAQSCRSLETDAQGGEREAAALAQRLKGERRNLRQLERQRRATPSTVQVDIIDTLRYPVRDVRRTCRSGLQLDMQAAWAGSQRELLRAKHSTRDRTHEGHPRLGLYEDPLQFPLSDADLIAHTERVQVARAHDAIALQASAYYAHLAATGLDLGTRDPHAASDVLVAIVLAAPGQLSDAHQQAIASHLRQHYGLEQLNSLRA